MSLIVVRGCSCQVERSVDGAAWTAVGRSSGYTAVVPARAGAARYVRVTGVLAELREVSVWDAAPAPPAASPEPKGAGPVATAAPATSSRQGPALLALAALLAAALAVAALAARSRR